MLRKIGRIICFVLAGMALSACSGTALHPCEIPDCTNEGTHLHLDTDGAPHYYCEVHYSQLYGVQEDPAAAVEAAETKDPSLCEVCDLEGVLTLTDANGTEHLYCSEHYEVAAQQQAETAANGTVRGCDVCGRTAILSTRGADGVDHYYCVDHYSEMLGMLG